MSRRRLDAELVRRGLAASRSEAQHHIAAGMVLVGGVCADKPARMVAPGEPIVLTGGQPPFVSRAGGKLDAALDHFGIDVAGRDAIDVGASTGGFTDCLLQRGAASVVALDVGHGQLHERIRSDPRVRVIERCNIRSLDPKDCTPEERTRIVGPPAEVVVTDLSFISLRTVSGALGALTADTGVLVALVKPQFEAGRREASRGSGVISDPTVWASVLGEVLGHYTAAGLIPTGLMVSAVQGTRGNVEFVAVLRPQSQAPTPIDVDAVVAGVVANAAGATATAVAESDRRS